MAEIKHIDKIHKVLKEWKPHYIAFIKYIEWSDNSLTMILLNQNREMVNGWPDFSKEFFEVCLKFEQISNLELQFGNSSIQQVEGFNIIDISKDFWEDVNFKIVDYENGIIEFYCKDIEVLWVKDKKLYNEFFKN